MEVVLFNGTPDRCIVDVSLREHPGEEDWMQVKRRCLVTVGLTKVKTAPDVTWKHALLKSRHSPIRRLFFSVDLIGIPYWLSTEFSRHVHAQPYIKSQRNDRQKDYNRNKAPQDAPVNMIWDFNADEFITICEKRLCGVATKEANIIIKEVKRQVIELHPEFEGLLDPFCVKYHCCNEMKSCGRLNNKEI